MAAYFMISSIIIFLLLGLIWSKSDVINLLLKVMFFVQCGIGFYLVLQM